MGHGQASLVFCTRSFGRTATRTTIIGCPDGSTVKCEVVRWRWHDDARQAQFSQILIFTSLCFFFDWEFERFLHHVLHGRISWARKQRENIHQEFSEMRLFLYHNKWSQCCFIVSLISCTYHCDTSLVMIYNYLICNTTGFGNVEQLQKEMFQLLRLPTHRTSDPNIQWFQCLVDDRAAFFWGHDCHYWGGNGGWISSSKWVSDVVSFRFGSTDPEFHIVNFGQFKLHRFLVAPDAHL